MSDLIAIAYDDESAAERVRQELGQLTKEKIIELDDAVVVTRDAEGKVKLHQAIHPVSTGAAGGALWGSLIGLIFLMPLMGLVIGAATGAVAGSLTDAGVDDTFMTELGERLQPNSAALIVLVRRSTPDKVLPHLESFGGHVIQASLSDEDEQRLRDALGE